MEDLIGRANTLKSIKNETESKRQEEERQRQAQLDILIKQSDERASQFVDIMREHDIPQVDVIYIDCINAEYAKPSKERSIYEKHLVGRGWVVRYYEASEKWGERGEDGIVLLEDLRSYRLGGSSRRPLPEGIDNEEEYVCIGHEGIWNHSKNPKLIDNDLLTERYSDRYKGLDVLGEAIVRYGIV